VADVLKASLSDPLQGLHRKSKLLRTQLLLNGQAQRDGLHHGAVENEHPPHFAL
jgi:hypothetical protein